MSKPRRLPSAYAHALPYRPLPARPPPFPPSTPKTPPTSLPHRKSRYYLASGLFLGVLTLYTTYLATTLLAPAPTNRILPEKDTDVSSRYRDESNATNFDSSVALTETLSGLNRLRKRLVSQARGYVLEVSCGTGRNGVYYDVSGGKVRKICFVDQSAEMVTVARRKWEGLWPKDDRFGKNMVEVEWRVQDIMSAFPLPVQSVESGKQSPGFTTIIQTMGICSMPEPAAALRHLGTILEPSSGRILLLEHGRSHYSWVNWILDRAAGRHADRWGCWFNRDIGRVLEESGLVVERLERFQLGTVWYVEARAPGWREEGKSGVEKTKNANEGNREARKLKTS